MPTRSAPLLETSALDAQRADPALRTAAPRFQPVDWSRPFVPEEFTQLAYTPQYATLTREQQLRYNQLFAIKINEQVMIFEQAFADRLLARLVGHRRLPADVSACLAGMVAEEAEHTLLFRELNRLCLPDAYARSDSCFTAPGWLDRAAFRLFTATPSRLPFLLFFSLALEEYSLVLSRAYRERTGSATLGPWEPNFVAAHVEHARDEGRHIHVEAHVIRRLFHDGPALGRRINAALLRAFFRNVIVPRRSGQAVLRRWLADHPELKPRAAELAAALRALGTDERFQRSLFNRAMMPLTFALFDADPAFRSLGRVLVGYDRREAR